MKKINQLLLAVAATLAMVACTADDSWYNEKWTDTTSTTASDDDNSQTTASTSVSGSMGGSMGGGMPGGGFRPGGW